MKKLVKIVGCILIVCGIVAYLAAGAGEDIAQGTKVSVGYKSDGQYTEISSGYMGRNEQGIKDMGYLKGIAALCLVAGAGALIGAAIMKEESY